VEDGVAEGYDLFWCDLSYGELEGHGIGRTSSKIMQEWVEQSRDVISNLHSRDATEMTGPNIILCVD
jgi:hypothetical protein